MDRQEAIRMAEKELRLAQQNLLNGMHNKVPKNQIEDLERKVDYKKYVYDLVYGGLSWIDNADSYICPVCGKEVNNPAKYPGCKCPCCGFQSPRDREREMTK